MNIFSKLSIQTFTFHDLFLKKCHETYLLNVQKIYKCMANIFQTHLEHFLNIYFMCNEHS